MEKLRGNQNVALKESGGEVFPKANVTGIKMLPRLFLTYDLYAGVSLGKRS